MTRHRLLVVSLCAALTVPAAGLAQGASPVPKVRREIPGLDFRRDGVWRREARAVRAARRQLLAGRRFPALNAPLATGRGMPLAQGAPPAASTALSGVLRVPAILFRFRNTFPVGLHTPAEYDQVLFAPSPTGASAGRPYTYTSYYAELSNGLLSVQGKTYGYAALDSNELAYTGIPGSCAGNPYGTSDCNGLFSSDAFTRMQRGLTEALRKLDAQVNWKLYDGNGDGYVDLVAFIHPTIDGACGPAGNNHLWSHRYFLFTPYVTHSVNSQGKRIKIADYILESGVGGADACDSTRIMPIGTVAHETGHGFSLPDLYDTDQTSEGVGEYSLMGSGNYTSPLSPSRMDAWSLSELGWVTVVPLTSGGPYSFGAAPTSDTTFYVPVAGANPRGEYFLLENREAVQSDSAMIRYHCQVWYASAHPPGSCGGGLIVWHVDSAQIEQHGFDADNRVNAGPIHGLELVQADGRFNLDADPNTSCAGAAVGCSDRGDAGDLYPGTTGRATLAASTVPTNVPNSGGCPGFRIDSVSQLVPTPAMRFVLSTGPGLDSLAIATAPRLPAAQWGYAYSLPLQGACGTSAYAWTIDSGTPPPGMALSAAGVLSGPPADTGTYGFAATVKSAADSARRVFTLHVGEPELRLREVLTIAFQAPQLASDDRRRYLDLQGNGNAVLDIGDVLRWMQRTGNLGAAAAGMLLEARRP